MRSLRCEPFRAEFVQVEGGNFVHSEGWQCNNVKECCISFVQAKLCCKIIQLAQNQGMRESRALNERNVTLNQTIKY